MNRREWLRNAGLITAYGIAADQIELLERLVWKRSLFPGHDFGFLPDSGTLELLDRLGNLLVSIPLPKLPYGRSIDYKGKAQASGAIARAKINTPKGWMTVDMTFTNDNRVVTGQEVWGDLDPLRKLW